MNKNSEGIFHRSDLFLLFLVSGIELIAADLLTAIFAYGAGTPFLFGFAKRWLIIISIPLLAAIVLLVLAFYFRKLAEKGAAFVLPLSKFIRILYSILSILLILWGLVSFIVPETWFTNYRFYVTWLTPVSLALALIALQPWIVYWKRSGHPVMFEALKELVNSIPFLVSMVSLTALFVLISLTKFGVVANQDLWKGPGVPLSTVQFLYILAGLNVISIIRRVFPKILNLETGKVFSIAAIILLYGLTLFLWGTATLKGDALAVEQTYPYFQPYPRQDALTYDLGATSILQGKGILFHRYTDKPLYMIILAILHLFSDNNYVAMQWAQIALLALIPVFIFLLGKRFHNPLLGILISLFVIFQQRNAVFLSRTIASVNVKILATEPATLLGVVLVTLIFLKWMENKQWKYALLLGGVIGASALVRLNPVFFFPAAGLMIYLFTRKNRRVWVTSLLLFTGGFVLVFSPWLITGTDSQGVPWVYEKIKSVINTRIKTSAVEEYAPNLAAADAIQYKPGLSDLSTPIIQESEGSSVQSAIKVASVPQISNLSLEDHTSSGSFVLIMAQHFTHNIVTSFLSLPDLSLDLKALRRNNRAYWLDDNSWNGQLPYELMKCAVLNLFLVALGLAESWKRRRWEGLVPLILFLVYDLSLSMAMTSGGRYIVPIYWIINLYYGLGLISLIDAVYSGFQRKPTLTEKPIHAQELPSPLRLKPLLPALIGLILVAALIPVANLAMPLMAKPQATTPAVVLSTAGQKPTAGVEYQAGTALYPVYDAKDESLSFFVLENDTLKTYRVSARTFLADNQWLQSGEEVIAGLNQKDEIKELYILRDGEVLKY